METETIRLARKKITDYNETIIKIIETQDSSLNSIQQYMTCYTTISNVSGRERGEDNQAIKLFNDFVSFYITRMFKNKFEEKKEQDFLEGFIVEWNNFKMFLFILKNIFYKIDKFFLEKRTIGSYTLVSSALDIMKNNFFTKNCKKINEVIGKIIEEERNEEKINSNLLLNIINVFKTLSTDNFVKLERNSDGEQEFISKFFPDYYLKCFEKSLLESTEIYYKRKTEIWLKNSVSEYVNQILKVLNKEKEFSEAYFPESKAEYLKLIKRKTIEENAEQVAKNRESGVFIMFKNQKREQLKQIFTLFSHLPNNYVYIAEEMKRFILESGEQAITNLQTTKEPILRAIKFIEELFNLLIYLSDITKNIFGVNSIFDQSIQTGFKFILQRNSESSIFLSLYCDNEFKKAMKSLNEDEIENRMNLIIQLFSFLSEKDRFFQDYEKKFAKRLINGTSLSLDHEIKMISKLKTIAGTAEVLKLNSFYNDFITSQDLTREFNEQNSRKFPFDMEVKIIRQSCWPFSTVLDSGIQFSEEISCLHPMNLFKEFYKMRHPNLKLQWIFSQGMSEVNSLFTPKKYIFVLNNLQLIILLLFNYQTKSFSIEEICSMLNLAKNEVENNVNAFVDKSLMIKREENSKEKYFINRNFTSVPMKINLLPKGRVAAPEENKSILNKDQEELIKLREFHLEALIVRIFKAKKKMSFQEVYEDVMKLTTNFTPVRRMIKAKIETLISKDYLKRDERMFLLMFLKGKNNEEEFFVISLIEMKTNDIYYSG